VKRRNVKYLVAGQALMILLAFLCAGWYIKMGNMGILSLTLKAKTGRIGNVP
jgi:hypothetical protein